MDNHLERALATARGFLKPRPAPGSFEPSTVPTIILADAARVCTTLKQGGRAGLVVRQRTHSRISSDTPQLLVSRGDTTLAYAVVRVAAVTGSVPAEAVTVGPATRVAKGEAVWAELELLEAFESPRRVNVEVTGRRFGSKVVLERDALGTTTAQLRSIVKGAEDSHILSVLHADEVCALDARLHELYVIAERAATKTTPCGLTLEDLVTAHRDVVQAMVARSIPHRAADGLTLLTEKRAAMCKGYEPDDRDTGHEISSAQVCKVDAAYFRNAQTWDARAAAHLTFERDTVYLDLRFGALDRALGWRVNVAPAGGRGRQPASVDTARQLAAGFSKYGTDVTRPIAHPARMAVEALAPHDPSWLLVDAAEYSLADATTGITARVAKLHIEPGLQSPTSLEYFLSDPTVRGLGGTFVVRQAPGRQSEPGRDCAWVGGFTRYALPNVLRWGAVEARAMPPLGESALPQSLMDVTPEEFRYWRVLHSEDARKMRDALVASEFFAEDNVVLGEGRYQRIQSVTYSLPAYDQPVSDSAAKPTEDPEVEVSVLNNGCQMWDDTTTAPLHKFRPPAVFDPARPSGSLTMAQNDHGIEAPPDELYSHSHAVEPRYKGARVVVERRDGATTVLVDAAFSMWTADITKFINAMPAYYEDIVLDGFVVGLSDTGEPVPWPVGYKPPGSLAYVATDMLYMSGGVTPATAYIDRVAHMDHIMSLLHDDLYGSPRRYMAGKRWLVPSGPAGTAQAIARASREACSTGAVVKLLGGPYPLVKSADHWYDVHQRDTLHATVIGMYQDAYGLSQCALGVGPVTDQDLAFWGSVVKSAAGAMTSIGTADCVSGFTPKIGDIVEVSVSNVVVEGEGARRLRALNAVARPTATTSPSTLDEVLELSRCTRTLMKRQDAAHVDVRVYKAEAIKEERLVFGVVLVPDDVDAQGDVYSSDEVRKAAYSFMEQYGGRLKVMHRGEYIDTKARVLESYVSKHTEKHGKESFPAGTWFMTSRIYDDDLWTKAKTGEFTGYSIGGSALRESLD